MAFPGSVTADIETANASGSDDVADDAAFLIHPTDPTKSVIVTTNKDFASGAGGLYVYDLTGALVETEDTSLTSNAYNNVDIRYNFGGYENIIGATNRESLSIEFWTYNWTATTDELTKIGTIPTNFTAPETEPYGFCMGRWLTGGVEKFYAFASSNNGREVKQWELTATNGVIGGTLVRTLPMPNQVEGMVVDDQNGKVYIGIEDVELRKYDTNPATTAYTVVDTTSGNLTADIEGLAIYYGATASDGYLIASSQAESKYCVYQRSGSNTFLGKFDIVSGATIDGATNTDGLDVTNVNMGGIFSQGAFIVHDAFNAPTTESNFKIVAFNKIATLGGLTTSTTYDPRVALNAGPPPPADPGTANKIGTWTQVGTGTGTVNATTKAVTIVPANDGTPCAMRQQIATKIGMTYWWTYELQTSTQCWRQIGTTAGGTDILNVNVSTVFENKFAFTATTTSVWIELTRTSSGTTRTGNHRFEEAPPGTSMARRVNGTNQYFKIDGGASGFRTSNSLQYVGGWFKFQYVPTAAVYLLDWAIPDIASAGGQRARIVYDPATPKLMASNSGTAGNGNRYMEDAHNGALTADVWRYVGISLAANGAVSCVYNGAFGGTPSGAAPDVGFYLTVMHLGSRNGTTPTNFAPAIYADWVWCAGFVPTNAQLMELMGGKRVTDVTGFSPTFYWPMEGTTTIESSTATAADLTANAQPGNVIGPPYAVPVVVTDEIPPLLMF